MDHGGGGEGEGEGKSRDGKGGKREGGKGMGARAVDSISFNFLDSEGSSERDTGGASRGEASRCYRISIYASPGPRTGLVTVPLRPQPDFCFTVSILVFYTLS